MADYSNTFGGAAKDAAESTILGADHDTQYDAVATSSATKANKTGAPATTDNLAMLTSSGDLADSLVGSDGSGNITANLTGNVTGTADAWTTTRTITMTGDVTADAVNIDGSGNIDITNASLANNSVDTAEIATGAVDTDEIAVDAVRFNNEIALGSASGTWSVSALQNIPRGVYNIYNSTANSCNVELKLNSGYRVVATLGNGDAYQIIGDGTDNVRLNSASGTTIYYDELYD